MLKKLAAFIFIFAVAAQVSAGVCGCLGEVKKHSCCSDKKVSVASMRPTSCCDKDCVLRHSETPTQDRTQPAAKLKINAVAEPAPFIKPTFEPLVIKTAVVKPPKFGQRLNHPRAPELYLHHHAFLI